MLGLGQLALAANEHRIVKLGDLNAHLAQLCGDALQMTRNNILHQNRTAAGCNGCHEGARLDLIRNDGVTAAVQALYTADLDHIGAGALTSAPIAFRKFARSTMCGSFAQFSIIV